MPEPQENPLDTLRRVAELARLELTPEEAPRLAEEFGRILAAFGSLRDVAADAADDRDPPTPELRGVTGRLRSDEPRETSAEEPASLAAAPERIDDFYGVPRTLGGEE